jgi:hypothetical protein
MSEKIKLEYRMMAQELRLSPSSKNWKKFEHFIFELKKRRADLDHEDTLLLIDGLTQLSLYKDAFSIIDNFEVYNKAERKKWYFLKETSERRGNDYQSLKYVKSRKFDTDRLLAWPFRRKISKK